jgi:hypothetical protein
VRNLVNREKCKACKVIIVVLMCKITSCIIVDNVYQVSRWELYHVWYKKLHCLLRVFFFLPMWRTVQLGLGRLILEVPRPHTIRYARTKASAQTHTVRLLWTSDQLVAEAAIYTTHNNGNRNHYSTNPVDENLRLRPHKCWDRLFT